MDNQNKRLTSFMEEMEKGKLNYKELSINVKDIGEGVRIYTYDQQASTEARKNPHTRVARSLAIRKNDDGSHELMSMSFEAFFNHGVHEDETKFMEEVLEGKHDGHRVFMAQKLDGSLISISGGLILTRNADADKVAFNTPIDHPSVKSDSPTFGEVAEALLPKNARNQMKKHDHLTFVFEITAPGSHYTRHDAGMTLLAIFDKKKLKEVPIPKVNELAEDMNLARPEIRPVSHMNDVHEYLASKSPDFEGVVLEVHNSEGQVVTRIKKKKETYLFMAHKLHAHPTDLKVVIPHALAETLDDFIESHEVISLYENQIRQIQARIDGTFTHLQKLLKQILHLDDKEFAKAVNHIDHPMKATLFQMKRQPIDKIRQTMSKKITPKSIKPLIEAIQTM